MKDSAKVLPTVRRARRHVKREEVVPTSNGMEAALAAHRQYAWGPEGNWRLRDEWRAARDAAALPAGDFLWDGEKFLWSSD